MRGSSREKKKSLNCPSLTTVGAIGQLYCSESCLSWRVHRGEIEVHQPVDVVGHARVGVELTTGVPGSFAQPLQIGHVVGVGKKAGLAVVPALLDMQGHAIKVNAGAAGHGQISTVFNSSPPPFFSFFYFF